MNGQNNVVHQNLTDKGWEQGIMEEISLDMGKIDRSLTDRFPYDFMKKHKILPIETDVDGGLILASGNPLDCHGMISAEAEVGCPCRWIFAPAEQIDRYLNSVLASDSASEAFQDLEDSIAVSENRNGDVTREADVLNNPTVRLVDAIIKEAIPYRASDIHIEPQETCVRVRYRIDGDLYSRAEFPAEAYSSICARIKILAGMNIAERRIPQDGRIRMQIGGTDYDFRVSTLPTVFGEKFAIRILDKTSFQFTRADLGFTPRENEAVNKMLAKPHGIILLTGPTGCGKSTTLYAFLKEVNDAAVNVVTVEDPVEYTMPGISQTQVNQKANLTFASALRSILRQDPDVIMIGEIRDEETAEIAVRSAITGHLVFSTLHTNDAPGAITRLEDMGVPDYLVADALVGVIAQRLVKKLCPACKRTAVATPKEMAILGVTQPVSISAPVGCPLCNHTGYKGRVAVHEIMYMSETMRRAVLQEKNLETLRRLCKQNGMTSLWDSCRELVLEGVTGMQELMSLQVE